MKPETLYREVKKHGITMYIPVETVQEKKTNKKKEIQEAKLQMAGFLNRQLEKNKL